MSARGTIRGARWADDAAELDRRATTLRDAAKALRRADRARAKAAPKTTTRRN